MQAAGAVDGDGACDSVGVCDGDCVRVGDSVRVSTCASVGASVWGGAKVRDISLRFALHAHSRESAQSRLALRALLTRLAPAPRPPR